MVAIRLCVPTLAISLACGFFPAVGLAQSGDGKEAAKQPEAPKSMPMINMGGMKPAKKAAPAPVKIEGDGKANATLTLDLRKFDFDGTKAANRMYMPSSAKLSAERPKSITKEPTYNGEPKYAVVTIGSGTPSEFVLVSDEAEGKEPRLFVDLNGNGDLTDDNTGKWQTKQEGKEGTLPSYQSTLEFKAGWKSAEGANTVGGYALNFYWQPGRGQLNYYSASARVGKITIDGKAYDVTLIENDGDGVYNKLFDPSKPMIVGEKMTKPVWLLLDGDQFDIRGTFPFGDMNYLATVSDDGSQINLAPTMRVVRVPRPGAEKVDVIAAGTEAPDFEALGWNAGQQKLDTGNRFKLSDYRGKKIVVLDMWATWCGPCMKGIPHLSKIAEAVSGQDVEVIALNTSDDVMPFEKFATGKGRDYKFKLARDPAGRDPNNNTIARKLYGVSGIPATFVIDKSGKIAGVVSGYSEGDTKVEQLLKGLGVKLD